MPFGIAFFNVNELFVSKKSAHNFSKEITAYYTTTPAKTPYLCAKFRG